MWHITGVPDDGGHDVGSHLSHVLTLIESQAESLRTGR